MGFKVGDRVTYSGDPAIFEGSGVIDSVKKYGLRVQWDESSSSTEQESDLIPEAKEEPPLAPWEKELLWTPFEQSVRRHTDRIANILVEKNKAYGDSALNPVRVFSKADREEQLYVRIDDKISRIQRGTDFATEDTIDDLIGYLLILKIAKESA